MNNYTEAISPEVYEKTPKAVFAAIAVSFALLMEDGDFNKVDQAIINEWKTLNGNGIVPQKPIKL